MEDIKIIIGYINWTIIVCVTVISIAYVRGKRNPKE